MMSWAYIWVDKLLFAKKLDAYEWGGLVGGGVLGGENKRFLRQR